MIITALVILLLKLGNTFEPWRDLIILKFRSGIMDNSSMMTLRIEGKDDVNVVKE